MTKLAIVIPVYNEEDTLPELCRRLRATCESLSGVEWQVVFVIDGGADRTATILEAERASESRIAVIELSRNFGQQAAITAGLAHADADAVVIMDGDLQDPPEVIPELVACWQEGAEVVRAERRSRQETGLRRIGIELFHRFFHAISDFDFGKNSGVFSLLDRRAVEEFNQLAETHRFIPGLRSWIGFEQRAVQYDRQARAAGAPKQTFPRLVQYAMDAVFSFSFKPLRLMTLLGLVVSSVGFALACWFVVRRLIGAEIAQTGFTTLVTLILFLGGIQLMAIGILGEYLGRIYDEVKRRPLFIVKRRAGVEPPKNSR